MTKMTAQSSIGKLMNWMEKFYNHIFDSVEFGFISVFILLYRILKLFAFLLFIYGILILLVHGTAQTSGILFLVAGGFIFFGSIIADTLNEIRKCLDHIEQKLNQLNKDQS